MARCWLSTADSGCLLREWFEIIRTGERRGEQRGKALREDRHYRILDPVATAPGSDKALVDENSNSSSKTLYQ